MYTRKAIRSPSRQKHLVLGGVGVIWSKHQMKEEIYAQQSNMDFLYNPESALGKFAE